MGVQKTYSYATSKGVAGGIYDMFQHFRSCNTSFLINMPDQQHRCMRFFRKTKNRRRTLSDLRYTSGRRFDTFGGNSLYRVNNH